MHPKSLRKEEIPHQTCPGREVNSHRIACSRMASICGGNQSLDKHEKSTNSDFLCQVSRAYLSWDINWFNMSANFQLLSFRHLASLLLSKNGPGSTTTFHSLGRRGMIMLEARLERFITFPTNVTESVNFEYSCPNLDMSLEIQHLQISSYVSYFSVFWSRYRSFPGWFLTVSPAIGDQLMIKSNDKFCLDWVGIFRKTTDNQILI